MMLLHSEFEYIESSVVVRAYTLGGRLNAYKFRGYCDPTHVIWTQA